METSKLKKFAQYARRSLIAQVSVKIKAVLAADSLARRENPETVVDLEKLISTTSLERVIEKIAYVWFNRFCGLRFMDVNRYTNIGIVSSAAGQFQPEILADAKMGHIDAEMVPEKIRHQFFSLLDGGAPSRDPQQEAYALLLVAVCNYYHRLMPFLFERIADYTELLMPDDLLSGNSILAYTREAMTPDVCQDVEVIGWLYQFYISEKKDEVFEGLKKNRKITPENIPAATQLFTPHWIVKYLVENSLGRLWMLNRPHSRLAEKMEYYIKSESPETDFLKISKPEEIKLCDPASGSGHMLVYGFDILYFIYEEEGYEATEIPRLILENNLYGIEIDERAGELAAFALTMKARQYDKRFFSRKTANGKPVEPNICVLQNISFEVAELKAYMDKVGRDLFTVNLQTLLHQFAEADNFGSLIRPAVTDVTEVLRILEEKKVADDLFMHSTHERVLLALKQADYLSPKYHVVIANPPYMGGKGMNGRLGIWVKDNYPDSKSDLFAMFIERNLDLAVPQGMVAMITMQSWMFLSSFEKLRTHILGKETILSMTHLGARAFDSIGGEVVSTTAFVLGNMNQPDYKGAYLRLVDGNSEAEKQAALKSSLPTDNCQLPFGFFRASAADFRKIPSNPIAYWLNKKIIEKFATGKLLGGLLPVRGGMTTADNDHFVRLWHEISCCKFAFPNSGLRCRWFPYNKGGEYRKWFGNRLWIVDWGNDGQTIKLTGRASVRSEELYLTEMVGWTDIASFSQLGVRYYGTGFLFDASGPAVFPNEELSYPLVLGFLGSKIASIILQALNATLHVQAGNISDLPWLELAMEDQKIMREHVVSLVNTTRVDWNTYETSWDFASLLLLHPDYHQLTLKGSYRQLRAHWHEMTMEMQSLEEENNRIFIEAYGLQEELTPEVPFNEITLTCNPHYRYSDSKSEEELESLLLADTMKEFVSYAVGCMFGRYSLDKLGLILANQGETVSDYLAQVPNPTFEPDADNVIPILDEGWFTDDITERFCKFLRVTFGEEHYDANLSFIEGAIGKDLRKYFLKDFYNDHVKRYKKRPIYWLFSSPKGSFNALIYMHRYRPDTISVVLNDYLREFRTKLSARKDHLDQINISAAASPREKTQALKDLEKLRKIIMELDEYERETLYPLATRQIEIALDDGVKVNYRKFGDALKKIPGLDSAED
ncbi:MAG: BREX-1 system adenine-specific DNA-methyltransferase PglX [Syntrophales bacterium]